MNARRNSVSQLENDTLDVLVIGGGIVGACVARDAAMRGLRTGLVERRDFASGTSSRSSRLLHGGIRYLAQGRIGLVREASLEKTVLHKIAPHLSDPLPFVFPTYEGNPHWKLWQLKIGVKLYDLLCSGRNLGSSSWLSAGQAVEQVNGLRATGLQGAVRYFDGFTNDARLVLDTLRSAARHQAAVLNYATLTAARREGPLWITEVIDEVSGACLTVKARTVVNATGPWADGLLHSAVKLRVTKGIHVVVDQARLPVMEAVVMTDGSRILFAIPWGRRTILGTTDTDYNGSLDDIRADAEDIAYVLRVVNDHFPALNLTTSDVLSTWAGVRPLIADKKGRPSDISRSHEIRSPQPGWWDVAGGKLTTCRLMAEQTVDKLVHAAGMRASPCSTAETPLLPVEETHGFSALVPPPVSEQVVRHACEQEWAVHLGDVLVRRTGWLHYQENAANLKAQVAGWMAPLQGWDDARLQAELTRPGG